MFGYSSPPVFIESGIITAVYPQEYLADVITVRTKRVLKKVPYATPLLSGQHGINFCPPRGSYCWVMLASSDPSNADVQISPSILAWQSVQENGSYRGGRKDLDESDISMSTPGGAEVLLRSGGLAEIRGGGLARTMYIPTTNCIYSIAQNVETHTPTGDFVWATQSAEDAGGSSAVAFTLKQVSSDAAAFLKISAGESTGGLEVVLLKNGDEGSDVIGDDGKPVGFACSWKIGKDGNVSISAESAITLEATEAISAKSEQISLTATSNIDIVCGDAAATTTINITPTGITIRTPKLLVAVSEGLDILTPAGERLISTREGSPAPLTASLLPFLLNHTHTAILPTMEIVTTDPPTGAANIVESHVTTQSKGIL